MAQTDDELDPGPEILDTPPDDGLEAVPIGEDPEVDPATQPFEYDEESGNLCIEFAKHPIGEKALDDIGQTAVDSFDEGFKSTEAYRDQVAKNWTLFTGELKPKTFPYKDAANAHVPIALENITRIYFRAIDELFSDWQNVFGVVPLGEHDLDAQLLTTHGNWQIRTQITDFQRQMHAGILGYFFIGDMTAHSYYSESRRMNRHEIITPDEFVIPYRYTSRMSDYSDCPWVAKVLTMYRHELEQMSDVWCNVDDVLDEEAAWSDEPEQPIHDKVAENAKIDKQDTKGTAPHKLIWWEGWYALPAQGTLPDAAFPDEPDRPTDVKQRYIQAIVHKKTMKVLSLLIHERPNWQDKLRFETQQKELIAYRAQVQAHQQAVMQQQEQLQAHTDTAVQLSATLGPMQQSAILGGLQQEAQIPPPPPPVPPKWMHDPNDPVEQPEEPRMEPVYLFTHAVCIEPLVGNLGLGFGRIQADYNRAANTALSQFTDAATMANVKSFVVTDGLEFNGSKEAQVAISPGSMLRASGMTSVDLRENIMPLEFGPANPQLLDVVKLVYGYGQSSAQAPEALSGEPGKSGETARGLGMRIEQATKQLSVPTRKFADTALVQILRNNAYLNSMYLPEEEIFAVQDNITGLWKSNTIGRKLYERNYNVEIRADLRFVSQTQRIQEADDMVSFVFGSPLLQNNLALAWIVVKKALEARGRQDMIQYLGPPPAPPTTPLGVAPPQPPPPPGAVVPPQAGNPNAPPGGGPPQGGQP